MKLIITIIPRNKGDYVSQSLKKIGCPGATIVYAKGTAKNQILELFGLGSSDKEIVYVVAKNDEAKIFSDKILEISNSEKKGFGILFTLNCNQLIKSGNIEFTEENEKAMSTHTLITAIVNSGLAEDAMAAARKAGASGGTIINARGTGKEEDVSFFGIQIVPEKEMLIILATKEQEQGILDAITTLPCLQEKGSGITFCTDVDNFTMLGAK